ncbi:hypothetical protein NDU88_008007 [Pleurodeles waltl]|uniref:Uncharacterized protein n=1 Tax=Pleurodeles waltl TaxID=8319 RepID=A0AAV7QRL8_PLEWA|nr:hypothetical protein NDU88_008007 [Pleurodeles waltl]
MVDTAGVDDGMGVDEDKMIDLDYEEDLDDWEEGELREKEVSMTTTQGQEVSRKDGGKRRPGMGFKRQVYVNPWENTLRHTTSPLQERRLSSKGARSWTRPVTPLTSDHFFNFSNHRGGRGYVLASCPLLVPTKEHMHG